MTTPLVLPDWVPWWVPFMLIVPTLLYALAFTFMPFSVLGVKPRLESIEARLEDLHQELRSLSHRLPAGREEVDFEEVYAPFTPRPRRDTIVHERLPAAIHDLDDGDEPVERPAPSPSMRPYRRMDQQVVRPLRAEPHAGSRR